MAEIIVSWLLGFIAIVIAWGGVDTIAVPIKVLVTTLARSLQTPERNKCLQIAVAGFLAVAVIWIMVAAADTSMGEGAGLPALLIWAGGLWLIPFRFDVVGHYGLSSIIAIAVILALFLVGSASHPPARMENQTEVSTQQGQDASANVTGLGFLFWIALIGLTVAAIARYTSPLNAAVLNS